MKMSNSTVYSSCAYCKHIPEIKLNVCPLFIKRITYDLNVDTVPYSNKMERIVVQAIALSEKSQRKKVHTP